MLLLLLLAPLVVVVRRSRRAGRTRRPTISEIELESISESGSQKTDRLLEPAVDRTSRKPQSLDEVVGAAAVLELQEREDGHRFGVFGEELEDRVEDANRFLGERDSVRIRGAVRVLGGIEAVAFA